MRVKIECYEKDFKKYADLFEKMGIEVSNDPTHLFKDLSYQPNGIDVYDEDGKHTLYHLSDIYLIETSGRKYSVITNSKTYFTNEKLYEIETGEYSNDFVRVNKSQIISLSKIKKISPLLNSKLKIRLVNDKVVYVTRTYIHSFKKKIQERGK